ncbi:NAD-dependent epimerase/dehydratase family protein [Limibacillus halophilus]|uniref:UDP-glucuronate 4-epimerase n=1 Tax=Limibacillus halophilus TaxID=1579333 RepID=A0A839SPB2_9PROT|nr:NAD-dependent epimerase/dehydratase family protein [Limibacillus halophilus]MBB3064651.1 UDP-glucuronate 4-epimerase [Limibacillus halophilus]
MTYLVTGAAGFIGYHTARALLDRGESVVGIDNLNTYYSPQLKADRLARLLAMPGFGFHQVDIADAEALKAALAGQRLRRVVHLAAQAGVRHSIENPHAYVQANLVGHLNMLELCRRMDGFEHMVYASSSSVYGGNTKVPFSEADRVDAPVSLYAATKKADELMSHCYAHLYRMPLTGLRFFTVYGPWGRPDMAMWLFTEAILAGRSIKVFNHGRMKRDFTFIDDIVQGVLATLDAPPRDDGQAAPQRLYNIGNNHPESLLDMIAVLEDALGQTASKEFLPLQPGDVPQTSADITAIQRDHGFQPRTTIAEGIPRFVDWYKSYRGL